MSSVPQFIDVEDKIAGPLTWKQLGWLIAAGAVVALLFMIFGGALAIVLSVPVVLFFLLLAFYKPNGFPMTSYIGYAFLFLFRPKLSVWERPVPRMISVKSRDDESKNDVLVPQASKELNRDTLKELARIIDSRQ